MEIRAAGPGDVAGAVAFHDELVPYLVVTRGLLSRRLAAPVTPGRSEFAALDDGNVVAWATSNLIAGSDPLDGEVRVLVRPEYRGRGIGTRLLTATHAELRAAGAASARVFSEPGAVDWAARFGYRQTRQVHYAGIDPAKVQAAPETPSKVRLVPLTDVEPHQLYAADQVAQRTKPGDARITSRPYEEWLAAVWRSPDTVLDLSVAAVYDEQVIAFTLGLGDHTVIWSKMTSTMPEYRGRGLAKLVKATALRQAASAGVRGMYTANYDGNTPMLAVNDWLGYQRIATHAVLVCPLS
ncbi:GNAT family N-acetyltransferase [Kribbella solani]|uniref:GNAT family N-acetyltransferase n=1 Tax=Kribbella solani TaxID=236067 RepID=UPI0029BC4ECC|nr:GNAT family N-acetyltransferase [Kribbella solani]MDX3004741.1 GNAT family N-acetyltransferase [Kribbella solani]